jgi:Flp pilus assembly protein TadG
MKARSSLEKGQSMVLIVLGIFVLFGFTALAIDGGMVYSDRRNAQNAADAAALAAGLQKANLKNDQKISDNCYHYAFCRNVYELYPRAR